MQRRYLHYGVDRLGYAQCRTNTSVWQRRQGPDTLQPRSREQNFHSSLPGRISSVDKLSRAEGVFHSTLYAYTTRIT